MSLFAIFAQTVRIAIPILFAAAGACSRSGPG